MQILPTEEVTPSDKPVPPGAVTEQLNRLADAIKNLHRSIDVHADRIHALLSPVPPASPDQKASVEKQCEAPLAEALRASCTQLEQATANLRLLTARLAL